MMRLFKSQKAQNTAEYAILIALVIAAAMAIQTYVKRGLQARVRDAVIGYSDQTAIVGRTTTQYEPYYLQADFTTGTSSSQLTSEQTGGGFLRTSQSDLSSRAGYQEATAPVDEA
jgi:hypothetical protein